MAAHRGATDSALFLLSAARYAYSECLILYSLCEITNVPSEGTFDFDEVSIARPPESEPCSVVHHRVFTTRSHNAVVSPSQFGRVVRGPGLGRIIDASHPMDSVGAKSNRFHQLALLHGPQIYIRNTISSLARYAVLQ